MKSKYFLYITITSIVIIFSCSRKTTQTATMHDTENQKEEKTAAIKEHQADIDPAKAKIAGPPAIVYKTKADYYDKVPITLSEDKTRIISFPAKTDIYYKGELALPTKLNKGYLLDNRGINEDVAFLNITYEAYSRLDMTPPVELLLQMVIDDDPIIEMYNCGLRSEYDDIASELNTLIDKRKLKKFQRIK